MECIICFEKTNINNYTQLECCKQIVHNECLEKWIKININKITDISYCFYCKQKNNNISYIIDILDNSYSNINSNTIIERLETNNLIQQDNRNKNRIIIIILVISIVVLTIISIILLY